MEAMITQKRANRIAAGRARPVLLRRGRSSAYIDLTNHESVPQSQTSRRRIPGQPMLSRLS